MKFYAPALLVFALGANAGFCAPAEPPSYRLDDYNAPVPATLNGRPALGVGEARVFWEQGNAVFIDVVAHPPRPQGLAPGTVFVDKPHMSIKGAVWLPDVGRGALAAPTDEFFRRALATLSGGDLTKRIVFFCKRDCWMSWNAARRAHAYGYTDVLWFSEGVDGWREAGLPMSEVKPFQD